MNDSFPKFVSSPAFFNWQQEKEVDKGWIEDHYYEGCHKIYSNLKIPPPIKVISIAVQINIHHFI